MIVKILFTLVLMLTLVQAQEEAIRAAAEALLEVSHFRGVITGELDGEMMDGTIDYVAPDRFYMDTVAFGDTIAIGSTTYTNEGSGWEVLDIDSSELIRLSMEFAAEDDILSDVQVLPDETIDGKACAVYSFTNDRDVVVNYAKLWVDKATGLPVMYEGESEIDGSPAGTGTIRYDYDVVPEINAPIQ
jgi:outer membrane lipoprotein-sorting protein